MVVVACYADKGWVHWLGDIWVVAAVNPFKKKEKEKAVRCHSYTKTLHFWHRKHLVVIKKQKMKCMKCVKI